MESLDTKSHVGAYSLTLLVDTFTMQYRYLVNLFQFMVHIREGRHFDTAVQISGQSISIHGTYKRTETFLYYSTDIWSIYFNSWYI